MEFGFNGALCLVGRRLSARSDEAGRRGNEPQLAGLLPEPQGLRLAVRDDAGTSHQTGQQPSLLLLSFVTLGGACDRGRVSPVGRQGHEICCSGR